MAGGSCWIRERSRGEEPLRSVRGVSNKVIPIFFYEIRSRLWVVLPRNWFSADLILLILTQFGFLFLVL